MGGELVAGVVDSDLMGRSILLLEVLSGSNLDAVKGIMFRVDECLLHFHLLLFQKCYQCWS